jgi:LSU ribosomal protein L22P
MLLYTWLLMVVDMARIDWSVTAEDIIKRVKEIYGANITEDQIVKALGYEYRISWKKAVEVARFIKGFTIKQAEDYMNKVIAMKAPVPIRRFTKKQAHHTTPWEGWPVAKWPVKVAKAYLEVLKNLENNASYRGLSVDDVVIVHVAVHKGRKIRNYMPRAFGRSTPWFQDTVTIELAGAELPSENVPKKLKLRQKPY